MVRVACPSPVHDPARGARSDAMRRSARDDRRPEPRHHADAPSTPTGRPGRWRIDWADGHETTYDCADAALAVPVRVLPGRGRACPAGSTAPRP